MSQSGPSGFRKFFSKKVDEDKVEEEILSMVEEGHEQGLIEEGEMELINNIFEFGDKEAKMEDLSDWVSSQSLWRFLLHLR